MCEDIQQLSDRVRDFIRADRRSSDPAAIERMKVFDAENKRRNKMWSDLDLVRFAGVFLYPELPQLPAAVFIEAPADTREIVR